MKVYYSVIVIEDNQDNEDMPFDGPYSKPIVAPHNGISRAKHLAKQAMKSSWTKQEKEHSDYLDSIYSN